MDDSTTETTEQKAKRAALARGLYLNAVRQWLLRKDDDIRAAIFRCYDACRTDGDETPDEVSHKLGRMLDGLKAGNAESWAKFLSVHVGLSDQTAFATFKAISPFKDAIIMEQDSDEGLCPIMSRGDVQGYMVAQATEPSTLSRTFVISTVRDETKKPSQTVTRRFVVLTVRRGTN